MSQQMDTLALVHSMRLVMIAMVRSHPNPDLLRATLSHIAATADRMTAENIMMMDDLREDTPLYVEKLRFYNQLFLSAVAST